MGSFNFRTNSGLTGGKYFIKTIFGIILAINNWLYANKLQYLNKLF